MRVGTMHIVTPTYKPVGGVVKIMDYATHARSAGFEVSVRSPEPWTPALPLFEIDRFAELVDTPGVEFHSRERLDVQANDLLFVSLPDNYETAYRSLPRRMSPERIIHIIQSVRHVNPAWGGGYPLRLLTRPAARISINDVVAETIAPWLDPRSMHEVIGLGHDVGYFAKARAVGPRRPLRVGYTTWKSAVGDRVASVLGDDGYEFRAIRTTAAWTELRDLYHWADVFLSTPGPEEGLYLPGVEAMSAGCLVITPDAGGNMVYCVPGENCILVTAEDEEDYARSLRQVADMTPAELKRIRRQAYTAVEQFSLEIERQLFHAFLGRLWAKIDNAENASRFPR